MEYIFTELKERAYCLVYGETKQFYVGTNPIPNFDFEYWITDTFNTLEDWISISCSQSTSYDGSKSVRVDGTQNVEGWDSL